METTMKVDVHTADAAEPIIRLIKADVVCERVGISKITLYRKAKGGQFPPPRKQFGKSVAWVESEVNAWINARGVADAWRSDEVDA